MDREHDIEIALRKIEKHFGQADSGTKKMFAMLLSKTLTYRDRLIRENKPALTVGETQDALDAFMLVLKTQNFPNPLPERIKDLVVLWLEGLKENKLH